jgi:hypothetical protein
MYKTIDELELDRKRMSYFNEDRIGRLHSREDNPAVIHENGTKIWMKHGVVHRDNGPAVIYPSGAELWCVDGDYMSQKSFERHQRFMFVGRLFASRVNDRYLNLDI